MKRNKFFRLNSIPKRKYLENIVPNLTYKRMTIDELPSEIKSHPLTKKFNSVIAAASASSSGTMRFTFSGVRIDNGSVDEHPFVFCYGALGVGDDFGGIIDHGSWNQRTIPLEPWQEKAMAASGLTANFVYKGIPPGASGSLYDLKENGMLEGFSKQFSVLLKNKDKS